MKARSAAIAALLMGTLAGCGIESTDVIEFGQPATGVKRPGTRAYQAVLYFGAFDGIARSARPAKAPVTAEEAVLLLLKGPNEAETQRGYYSELMFKPGSGVFVSTGRNEVDIRLPVDVGRLSKTARDQLACTAANNVVPGDMPPGTARVNLIGGGRTVPNQRCPFPAHPNAAP